jgi:hypothetical protein
MNGTPASSQIIWLEERVKKHEDKMIELLHEIKTLTEDAGRYRWLREFEIDSMYAVGKKEKLDAAIDAAIARSL